MPANQTPKENPDPVPQYYLDVARFHVTMAALNNLHDTCQLNNLQSPNASLSLARLHRSVRALESEALSIIVLFNALTKDDDTAEAEALADAHSYHEIPALHPNCSLCQKG